MSGGRFGVPEGMRRIFFALPVSDNARERIASVAARAARDFEEMRWVPAANYHLTLKFVGEVPGEDVQSIIDRAAGFPKEFPAVPLVFDRLDYFGPSRSPRVLFVRGEHGGEAESSYSGLAKKLGSELKKWCKPDNRPFKSHLTLARFRTPNPGERLSPANEKAMQSLVSGKLDYARFGPVDSETTRVILYESRFERGGVNYAELASWPLSPR